MIKFSLVCDSGHAFDSWFANGAAFDEQAEGGFVLCPVCGSERVTKAIMAPAITSRRGRAIEAQIEAQAEGMRAAAAQAGLGQAASAQAGSGHPGRPVVGPVVEGRVMESRVIEGEMMPPGPSLMPQMPPTLLDAQQRAIRAMIGAVRAKILTDTIDVGKNFPEEARKMHDGESPERPIRGEATVQEAQALIEDGIKIMPVPAAPEELN